MTSADVIYTIEQLMLLTDTDSNYVYNKNLIAGFQSTDEYTVQITQSSPGYAAIYFMAFPVICKAYCESKDIDTAVPIGTGPYQVTEMDMQEQVLFDVNPTWWKKAPYIQKLTAVCIPDHDAEMSQFDQNLLDIVTTSSLTVDTYQKFEEIEYTDYLTHFYDCLVPNMNGLLGDVNLRHAIAYALDKRSVVSKALLGHAVAVDYPVSPKSYLSGGSSNLYEYNQQKARDLLALSGWTNKDEDAFVEKVEGDVVSKLTIKLLIPINNEDTYRIDVAQNVQTQLAECGISVEIAQEEPAIYKSSLESGNFDLALCTYYMDENPDISFLVGTDGRCNYGHFTDPLLDGLLANCNSTLSEDTKKTAYTSMEDQFLAQMPQIALYYRTNALLYDASLSISDTMCEKNLFTTIPQWYIYLEEPEA
jgi:ABC-type transport system substrate-binding protein